MTTTHRRLDVEFPSGDGTCAAWLYLPDADGPRPVIVMAHGFGAIREMRLDAFAERFAEAGYAALVFDYRHFGSSSGTPRQLVSAPRQRDDWRAAVAHVRSRDDVDTSQVVLWGTSFSGGHVIATAADDPAVVATIAQCPFTDGVASVLAAHRLSALKSSGPALRDAVGSLFGADPVTVATVGAPGEAALMATPDSAPGYLGLVPDGAPFANHVAARILLDVPRHRPGRRARDVTCPILFCVCEDDALTPPEPTLRFAAQAPRGEVVTYPAGHFDIYTGDEFEQVVADQLAFLADHVPVG